MPGFTHLQNAQPISVAHYFLAFFEMLERDKQRFKNLLNTIDECPLGSGALVGTNFIELIGSLYQKVWVSINQLTTLLIVFLIEILQ